jgi:hypothetical protein
MSARAGGDTLQGRQAYGVLTWVYEDPATRAAEGQARVRELASSATGDALREIQDVGTMLARLVPVQLTGIADQVLDLARTPAWVREQRNAHGEWTRGSGGTISSQIGVGVRHRAAQQRVAISKAQARVAAAMPPGPLDIERVAEDRARAVVAETTAELKAEQAHVVGEMLAKVREVDDGIRAAHAKIDTAKNEAEAEAHHKHLVKLAVDGLMAVATGLIAMISVKMGAPESLAVTLPVVPLIMQTIIEFLKKL